MKKIILLCSLLFGIALFANDGETVVYSNDIATGEVTDKNAEYNINERKKILKKLARYKELTAKKKLTGKETEELILLKDYIIDLDKRIKIAEEKAIKRNTAVAEQEVISNLGKQK